MALRLTRIWTLAGLVIGLAAAGLSAAPYLPRLMSERYPAPNWPAAGAFAELGLKTTPAELIRDLHAPNARLRDIFDDRGGRALLVFHDGALRMEHYADSVTGDDLFNSYSVIKSLIGLLTLKAVEEQKIDSLDAALGQYLPEIDDPNLRNLPLHKILDMKSGVLFETQSLKSITGRQEKDLKETMANPFGPMAQLHFNGVEPLLPQLKSNPEAQTVFNYQNINTSLLGLVLERVYQRPLQDILDRTIWSPSGAGPAYWRLHGADAPVTAYCCLYAKPVDWVHVARFIANNGTKDSPLLREDLWQIFMGGALAESAVESGVYQNQTRYNILDRLGQSLQGRFSFFAGRGGQTVYLMPERDLIVVRFGDEQQLLHSTLYEVWNSITPPS